jgi:hypothetical protein
VSITATFTRKIKIGSEELEKTETIAASRLETISEAIVQSQTDKPVNCTIDQSAMKYFYLSVDGVCTIETNDGTTPDDAFTLAAGQAILWTQSDPAALCPITEDVDKLYVTTPAGATVNIELRAGEDATP